MEEVFVVKEHEGEVGFPGSFLLILKKGVKASDGRFDHWLHRSRAVEYIGDFCELFVHGYKFKIWGGTFCG